MTNIQEFVEGLATPYLLEEAAIQKEGFASKKCDLIYGIIYVYKIRLLNNTEKTEIEIKNTVKNICDRVSSLNNEELNLLPGNVAIDIDYFIDGVEDPDFISNGRHQFFNLSMNLVDYMSKYMTEQQNRESADGGQNVEHDD